MLTMPIYAYMFCPQELLQRKGGLPRANPWPKSCFCSQVSTGAKPQHLTSSQVAAAYAFTHFICLCRTSASNLHPRFPSFHERLKWPIGYRTHAQFRQVQTFFWSSAALSSENAFNLLFFTCACSAHFRCCHCERGPMGPPIAHLIPWAIVCHCHYVPHVHYSKALEISESLFHSFLVFSHLFFLLYPFVLHSSATLSTDPSDLIISNQICIDRVTLRGRIKGEDGEYSGLCVAVISPFP